MTTTVPVIKEPCTVQKYGNEPVPPNVCEKLPPDMTPESHVPFAVQQAPDVVECVPLTQTQVTVWPAWIVVTFVPLWVSTKDMLPLGPTLTMCAALGVGVAPGGGVDIGVGVALIPGCVGDVLLLQ